MLFFFERVLGSDEKHGTEQEELCRSYGKDRKDLTGWGYGIRGCGIWGYGMEMSKNPCQIEDFPIRFRKFTKFLIFQRGFEELLS